MSSSQIVTARHPCCIEELSPLGFLCGLYELEENGDSGEEQYRSGALVLYDGAGAVRQREDFEDGGVLDVRVGGGREIGSNNSIITDDINLLQIKL